MDSAIGELVVQRMRSLEPCENAAIIGTVVATHPRQVVLTSAIGGKRVVNMLVGAQLPRIC